MKIHIPDFTQIHVLIVGDIMLDRYWYGATSRISPEAPVPVVKVDTVEERPGGGANVAVNIASLGGMARVLGVTGDDTAADALETKLARLHDLPVLVDSKGYDFSNYRGATLLTPNLNELETVLGPLRSEAELVDKGMALLYKLDLEALLVTRSEQGMSLLRRECEPLRTGKLSLPFSAKGEPR